MICPKCGEKTIKVLETREEVRKRLCPQGHILTTVETVLSVADDNRVLRGPRGTIPSRKPVDISSVWRWK